MLTYVKELYYQAFLLENYIIQFSEMGGKHSGSNVPGEPIPTLYGIVTIDVLDYQLQNYEKQSKRAPHYLTIQMTNQMVKIKIHPQSTDQVNQRIEFIVNSRHQYNGRPLRVEILENRASLGVGILDLQTMINQNMVNSIRVYLNSQTKKVGWVNLKLSFKQCQAYPITIVFQRVVIRRKTGSELCKIRATIGEQVFQTTTKEDRKDSVLSWLDEAMTFYVLKDQIKEGRIQIIDDTYAIGSIPINLQEIQATQQSQIKLNEDFYLNESCLAGIIKFIIFKGDKIQNKQLQLKRSKFVTSSQRRESQSQRQAQRQSQTFELKVNPMYEKQRGDYPYEEQQQFLQKRQQRTQENIQGGEQRIKVKRQIEMPGPTNTSLESIRSQQQKSIQKTGRLNEQRLRQEQRLRKLHEQEIKVEKLKMMQLQQQALSRQQEVAILKQSYQMVREEHEKHLKDQEERKVQTIKREQINETFAPEVLQQLPPENPRAQYKIGSETRPVNPRNFQPTQSSQGYYQR